MLSKNIWKYFTVSSFTIFHFTFSHYQYAIIWKRRNGVSYPKNCWAWKWIGEWKNKNNVQFFIVFISFILQLILCAAWRDSIPEVFEEGGGNTRMEGKNKRKKKSWWGTYNISYCALNYQCVEYNKYNKVLNFFIE